MGREKETGTEKEELPGFCEVYVHLKEFRNKLRM